MAIAAGDLRHYVSIQRYSKTHDSIGAASKVWVTIAHVYAQIQDVQASTTRRGEREVVDITHKIRVHRTLPILEHDRVVYGNKTFDILGIQNDDTRKIHQVLLCKSVYPEDTLDRNIDACGHTDEIANYHSQAQGYRYLDVDQWIIYERNSTVYDANPSADQSTSDLWTQIGSRSFSTDLAFTSSISLLGNWDSQAIPLTKSANALTITKVVATTDTGTLTFNLEERSSIAMAGTELLASDMEADSTGVFTVTFAKNSVAADNYIVLVTGTSAMTGNTGLLSIQVYYSVGG